MTTPQTPNERAPFAPRAAIESPDGTGARWWNQAMEVNAAGISRRRAIALQLGLGGGVLAIAVVGGVIASKSDDDDVESKMDALELQRRTSWNVGDVDRRLTLTDGRANDADGSEIWRTVLLNQRMADGFSTAAEPEDGSPSQLDQVRPVKLVGTPPRASRSRGRTG